MTPREFRAIQHARIDMIRLEWGGFARAAAAYFEGNRLASEDKGGSPILPDSFLPRNPHINPARLVLAEEELRRLSNQRQSRAAGSIPSWAKRGRRRA